MPEMHAENMFDRSDLLELSRKELQAKAKALGVPANIKTAEIVELMMAKASSSNAGAPLPQVDRERGVLQPRSSSALNLPNEMRPLQQVAASKAAAAAAPQCAPAAAPLASSNAVTKAAWPHAATAASSSSAAATVAPAAKPGWPHAAAAAAFAQTLLIPADAFDPSAVHSPVPEPKHPSRQLQLAAASVEVTGSFPLAARKGPAASHDGTHKGSRPSASPLRGAVSPAPGLHRIIRAQSPVPSRLPTPTRVALGESQPLRRPQSAAATSTVAASPLAIRAAALVAARNGSGIGGAATAAAVAAAPSGANGLMSPHRSRPVSASSNIGRGGGAGGHHGAGAGKGGAAVATHPREGAGRGGTAAGHAQPQLSPQRLMRDGPLSLAIADRGGGRGGTVAAAAAKGGMLSPLRGEVALATGGAGHRSVLMSPLRGEASLATGGVGHRSVLMSPLHSPLSRTPARRVTAGGAPAPAPAPAAAAAAAGGRSDLAGSQQFFDELVRRELSVPPGAAGMKSVIGMSTIKQRLLAIAATASSSTCSSSSKQQPQQQQQPWLQQALLFGPSGVGKTLLAKALAAEVASAAPPTTVTATAAATTASAAPPPIIVRANSLSTKAGSCSLGASSPCSAGFSFYVDVGRLLAGQQSGGQADKVMLAVFRALNKRAGPASLVLDNLEALQEQQQADDFERADAACRLRAAVVAGLDGLKTEAPAAAAASATTAPGLQQHPPQRGGGGVGSGIGGGGGLMAGAQRAKQQQQLFNQRISAVAGAPPPGAGLAPHHHHHPLVVVGVAGSHALSLDDGLARCFTAAKVHIPPPDADTRETLIFLDMAGRDSALGIEDFETLVKKTEGLSGSEVLRLCNLAAASAQRGGLQQRQRAKWGQQPPDAEPAAAAGTGGGGGVTLEHFVAVLEEARPCMSHAAAIAYLKWKGHLCAL